MAAKISRIGIITGVQMEADAFLPADDAGETIASPFGPVLTTERDGKAVFVHCTGIGKAQAAAGASWLIANHGVDLLLCIGTAGRISPTEGDCLYLHEAVQADYGAQQSGRFAHYKAGAWPIGPHEWTPFAALPQPDGLGLTNARIATADAFIECPDRSSYLRDTLACQLVDMETGAVAQIADKAGLPWAGIKACTDDADGAGAGDFEANLARAANAAADATKRLIALL